LRSMALILAIERQGDAEEVPVLASLPVVVLK
jgi:hypothetical protein